MKKVYRWMSYLLVFVLLSYVGLDLHGHVFGLYVIVQIFVWMGLYFVLDNVLGEETEKGEVEK